MSNTDAGESTTFLAEFLIITLTKDAAILGQILSRPCMPFKPDQQAYSLSSYSSEKSQAQQLVAAADRPICKKNFMSVDAASFCAQLLVKSI